MTAALQIEGEEIFILQSYSSLADKPHSNENRDTSFFTGEEDAKAYRSWRTLCCRLQQAGVRNWRETATKAKQHKLERK
jgi:hypothetical protein